MRTASDIKKQLGGRRIAAALGLRESAVGNHNEKFPAGYYPVIKRLCDESGFECPMSAFRWIEGTGEPSGAELQ